MGARWVQHKHKRRHAAEHTTRLYTEHGHEITHRTIGATLWPRIVWQPGCGTHTGTARCQTRLHLGEAMLCKARDAHKTRRPTSSLQKNGHHVPTHGPPSITILSSVPAERATQAVSGPPPGLPTPNPKHTKPWRLLLESVRAPFLLVLSARSSALSTNELKLQLSSRGGWQ